MADVSVLLSQILLTFTLRMNHLGNRVKLGSDSVRRGLGPKLCVTKKLPCDADAAGPWVIFKQRGLMLSRLLVVQLFYPQLSISK